MNKASCDSGSLNPMDSGNGTSNDNTEMITPVSYKQDNGGEITARSKDSKLNTIECASGRQNYNLNQDSRSDVLHKSTGAVPKIPRKELSRSKSTLKKRVTKINSPNAKISKKLQSPNDSLFWSERPVFFNYARCFVFHSPTEPVIHIEIAPASYLDPRYELSVKHIIGPNTSDSPTCPDPCKFWDDQIKEKCNMFVGKTHDSSAEEMYDFFKSMRSRSIYRGNRNSTLRFFDEVIVNPTNAENFTVEYNKISKNILNDLDKLMETMFKTKNNYFDVLYASYLISLESSILGAELNNNTLVASLIATKRKEFKKTYGDIFESLSFLNSLYEFLDKMDAFYYNYKVNNNLWYHEVFINRMFNQNIDFILKPHIEHASEAMGPSDKQKYIRKLGQINSFMAKFFNLLNANNTSSINNYSGFSEYCAKLETIRKEPYWAYNNAMWIDDEFNHVVYEPIDSTESPIKGPSNLILAGDIPVLYKDSKIFEKQSYSKNNGTAKMGPSSNLVRSEIGFSDAQLENSILTIEAELKQILLDDETKSNGPTSVHQYKPVDLKMNPSGDNSSLNRNSPVNLSQSGSPVVINDAIFVNNEHTESENSRSSTQEVNMPIHAPSPDDTNLEKKPSFGLSDQNGAILNENSFIGSTSSYDLNLVEQLSVNPAKTNKTNSEKYFSVSLPDLSRVALEENNYISCPNLNRVLPKKSVFTSLPDLNKDNLSIDTTSSNNIELTSSANTNTTNSKENLSIDTTSSNNIELTSSANTNITNSKENLSIDTTSSNNTNLERKSPCSSDSDIIPFENSNPSLNDNLYNNDEIAVYSIQRKSLWRNNITGKIKTSMGRFFHSKLLKWLSAFALGTLAPVYIMPLILEMMPTKNLVLRLGVVDTNIQNTFSPKFENSLANPKLPDPVNPLSLEESFSLFYNSQRRKQSSIGLSEDLENLSILFENTGILTHPHSNIILERLNREQLLNGIHIEKTDDIEGFKLIEAGRTSLMRYHKTNGHHDDLTIYEHSPRHRGFIKQKISVDHGIWYITEYLEIDMKDPCVRYGGAEMAKKIVEDITTEVRYFHNMGIVLEELKVANVRGRKMPDGIRMMLMGVTGQMYGRKTQIPEDAAKNAVSRLGELLMLINNIIRKEEHNFAGGKYVDQDLNYFVISDNETLADLIFVCLGATEHPPKNVDDLVRHRFFLGDAATPEDQFGRRKYTKVNG